MISLSLQLFFLQSQMNKKFTLRIACRDEKGLIFKISRILLENGANIERNDEFVDQEKNLFFMRTQFTGIIDPEAIKLPLTKVLPENAVIEIFTNKVKNVVIFVTKEHHCLADLLVRNHYHDLNFNILGVVGNRDNLQELTQKFDIPFHFVPSDGISREEHEAQLNEILKNYNFDFIVLAKFMRILTPEFVATYRHKIINIHHSFLPAFIGANPYRQAFERGVKMIGATSHFVTDDLDEGPIIFQDIAKINHVPTAKELSIIGKDVEKKVLSNALKLVFDDKVFIQGNKTIIFD